MTDEKLPIFNHKYPKNFKMIHPKLIGTKFAYRRVNKVKENEEYLILLS